MSFQKYMGAAIIAGLFSTAASAQSYVRTVEPTPEELNSNVRAKFIRASDVSPEEYARLLAEADKVRGYQSDTYAVSDTYSSTGSTYSVGSTPVYTAPTVVAETTPVYSSGVSTTYSSGNSAVYDGSPIYVDNGQGGYQIELYDTPIPASAATTTTYASVPSTTYSAGIASTSVISAATTSRHVVSSGDTLYGISKRYGVKVSELKSTNGLSSNTISIGQVLSMPSQRRSISQPYQPSNRATLVRNVEPIPFNGTYAVLPGDTLYNIAERACVSVGEIQSKSGISGTTIHPGQRLSLPTGHCLR